MEKKCFFDHVKYQISDKDWKCPRCGCGAQVGDSDGWTIQDSANFDCEELHPGDEISCEQCGEFMSGEQYSEWYAKKHGKIKKETKSSKRKNSKDIGKIKKEVEKIKKSLAAVEKVLEELNAE